MMNLNDITETLLYLLDPVQKDQRLRDKLKELIKETIAEEEYNNSKDRWED